MDTNSTRRDLLKAGIAAAGGPAVQPRASAQSNAAAVATKRRFRGWVSRGSGPGRTTLQDLTLRPISGRQVVVRTEATNLCYSNVGAVLGIQPSAPPPPPGATPAGPPRPAAAAPAGFGRLSEMALIQGHGGVGFVEAVGPDVRRVQVGDRVCVSGTPQCGACYQCLRGRADMCQFLGRQDLTT